MLFLFYFKNFLNPIFPPCTLIADTFCSAWDSGNSTLFNILTFPAKSVDSLQGKCYDGVNLMAQMEYSHRFC